MRERDKPSNMTGASNSNKRVYMITRFQALKLVKGSTKRDHSLLVSRIMKALAEELGKEMEEWEMVGLLHDMDYDLTKPFDAGHGVMASKILEASLSEEALYAIKTHDHRTGIPPRSLLDRSLVASNALAIFIEDQGIISVDDEDTMLAKLTHESTIKPWIKDVILGYCLNRGITLMELLIFGLSQKHEVIP